MTKVLSFLFLFIITFQSLLHSQDITQRGAYFCRMKKISGHEYSDKIYLSPNTPKHKYDVLHYNINVDIRNSFFSPYPKNFNGSVIIKFKVDTSLNQIDLNAVNTSLQINSVSMAGTSFTHSNNILLVNLNRLYNAGETASVKIDYQHLNVTDQAFYASNGHVFTDAPPEGARKWFPCYDKPFDKATVELTAKVPANAKLGSNGRLNDSLLTGDSLYYHWKSRDPIATYLIVMSARLNYNLDIVYWKKLSNPMDSIPIRFYYNPGEYPNAIKSIIGGMTTYYSQKFGEHPFEKNGFATLNNQFTWGGMENQTLTSLCPGCWQESLVSHEYAHQWFGDMITCGTWADVWLNEGFATYIESIWLEHTNGYTSYKLNILSDAQSYLNQNPGWAMYNPEWAVNTPSLNVLYNYAITYAKGAGVLHMLRYVLGDSVFFNSIKAYAEDTVQFKHKNAVTDDFTAKISQVSGQDMSWFINSWVKQPNHPVYQNQYEFINNGGTWTVNFTAKQIQTNTPFHKMPLTIKLTFANGPDTTFRVMNDVNNQLFSLSFNRQPVTLIFDPNNDIVLKQGSTSYIGIIKNNNITPKQFALYQNYPNPFNPSTKIKFDLPERDKIRLVIYDITGKIIDVLADEVLDAGSYEAVLEAESKSLSSGIYLYKLYGSKYTDVKRMVLIK